MYCVRVAKEEIDHSNSNKLMKAIACKVVRLLQGQQLITIG